MKIWYSFVLACNRKLIEMLCEMLIQSNNIFHTNMNFAKYYFKIAICNYICQKGTIAIYQLSTVVSTV